MSRLPKPAHRSRTMTPIILASASPRRRELFALLGLPFEIVPAEVREELLPGESSEDMARRLSLAKARAVADDYPQALIVAADTFVVLDGDILGKPTDPIEATNMLRRMRGREHQVLSGLALLDGRSGCTVVEVVETRVWMRRYSDEEIEHYVKTGDPMDKAGAYAIQHVDFRPVARVIGCPANVMGLPLCRAHTTLAAMGQRPLPAPVQTCRPPLSCAIRELVLPDAVELDERQPPPAARGR